ncbi:MAG: CoA pyrophosphatase [Desulfuromonadales bacterium]|nr:CoA pyrophosphatase [Desulfuromonadales bacterium]
MERFHTISMALNSHPAHIIEPGERVQAAVSLIMEDLHSGPSILFVERSTNENDYWSGHICLPGGRAEAGDKSPRHTAERETWEELGLDLTGAHYLGRLDDIAPGGLQMVVSCFVYAVHQHPFLSPDVREVADAFWVPVREFTNPARRTHVDFIFKNRMRRFPALRLVDDKAQPLWGLTYRLLRNFNKTVNTTIDSDR